MKFFNDDKEIFSASAPGRLDVMGGIADYSGSLVLQLPIAEKLTVQIQERDDSIISIQSFLKKDRLKFEFNYSTIQNKKPGEAGKIVRAMPGGNWATYVIGCLSVLESEKNIPFRGMNIEIQSKIPLGKGVASSAALEVATINAISRFYGIHLPEIELPLLAQQVENIFVGAACGLMDQLTVHLGQKNKLLPIICQPGKIFPSLAVPKGIQFSGIDSGVKHAVGSSAYSEVRAATFMAFTMIANLEGVYPEQLLGVKSKNNFQLLPYGGYLANIPVSEFEKKYATHLPGKISGREFIERYKTSIDGVTQVNEGKNYDLLNCARHPVYENHRVNMFQQLLLQFSKSREKEKILELLGELMLQSHESYNAVGLGHLATDNIVESVRKAGPASGVYGARVTGGGSGGTVVVLSFGKQGKQTVKEIFDQYKKRCEKRIYFFKGSENGAQFLNQQIKHHDYIDV